MIEKGEFVNVPTQVVIFKDGDDCIIDVIQMKNYSNGISICSLYGYNSIELSKEDWNKLNKFINNFAKDCDFYK